MQIQDPVFVQQLRSIKLSAGTTGSGTGTGCGNVKGFLDSYGTMPVDGAFSDTIPYLLKSGFLADGHGAAFDYHYPVKAEIGIFTDVKEDAEGLQLTWEYHDDPYSQSVRNKTAKRLANGKTCGMSIGFFIGDGTNPALGWQYDPAGKEPKGMDYLSVGPQYFEDILTMYSNPEYLQDNLERAQQFGQIYILLKVHVFETSQTEIPANEASLISELRHKSTNNNMENYRAKESEDSKLDDARDTHKKLSRALKNAKESHDAHSDDLDSLAKLSKELGKHLSKADDDDDDEAEPKEKKEKKERGRAAFTR